MVIYTKVSSVPDVTTESLRQEYKGKFFKFVETDILNKYKGQINNVEILFYQIPPEYLYYSKNNRVLIVVSSIGKVIDILRG